MHRHLRIARPVSDLASSTHMYWRGLGLRVIASFQGHAGFDGVMLGTAGADYHLEFTRHRSHAVQPTPIVEDLAVFYMPAVAEWRAACARMTAAGFQPVAPFNPYWKVHGRTFQDRDGYRLVLQREDWMNAKRK